MEIIQEKIHLYNEDQKQVQREWQENMDNIERINWLWNKRGKSK